MKIISPRLHGFFDYSYVVIYVCAPTILGLVGRPSLISYIAAALYLVGTSTTAFPLGLIKLMPFRIHLRVEYGYAILTAALPWIFGFSNNLTATAFYVVMGIIPFTVGLLTEYKSVTSVKH